MVPAPRTISDKVDAAMTFITSLCMKNGELNLETFNKVLLKVFTQPNVALLIEKHKEVASIGPAMITAVALSLSRATHS
jgi:hypothetical protein